MPPSKERSNIKVQAERTVLAAVRRPTDRYNEADPFGELTELAEQAGALVVGTVEQHRDRPEAGTYMGRGKIEELKLICEELEATAIIFDHELSPKQISNIEQMTDRKVLDRSELILDIFAGRATTHEARLQVELAQLEYTYPRLRAMWDHLERIVGSGGIGGVGTRGPGEQQLEIDRRLVQRRKSLLQKELAEIQSRKRRAVQSRKDEGFTVGLVGYTNAGKSTLFNSLTTGGAYADDRLFATLMTRTRQWDLGGGRVALLSDTVGFVRDLPHNLVASFRATLEEATHADLLLIVLDVSDPAVDLHYATVMKTLDDLFAQVEAEETRGCPVRRTVPPARGCHTVRRTVPPAQRAAVRDGAGFVRWIPPERLVLLNKADRLGNNQELLVWQSKIPSAIPICALPDPNESGQLQMGSQAIHAAVLARMMGPVHELEIRIPLSESKTIHTLESRGEVLDRQYESEVATLKVRVGERVLSQIRSAGTRMEIVGGVPEGQVVDPWMTGSSD